MKQTNLLPMLTTEQLEAFGKWYAAYPRKEAKLEAMRAWLQTESLHPPIETMVALVEQQKRSPKWHEDGGQYIPLPASYLRAGRFLDELKISLPSQASKLPDVTGVAKEAPKVRTQQEIEAARQAFALVRRTA